MFPKRYEVVYFGKKKSYLLKKTKIVLIHAFILFLCSEFGCVVPACKDCFEMRTIYTASFNNN